MDYFAAMVSEVMAMDADRSEKMKRLAAILKAQEMLNGNAEPAAPEMEEQEGSADEMKKAMAEAVAPIMSKFDALLESFGQIKAEHDARRLLESSGREVTAERVAALLAVDAGKRSAILESWPVSQRGSRPAASPPAAVNVTYPTDTRQFLAAIRSN